MPIQPIKNTASYEKLFSNELRNLLNNTVQETAREVVPSAIITPEIFFIGALGNQDCMLYKVLNGYLTTIKIQEIYDKILALTEDANPFAAIRPNRMIDYSGDMRLLFQRAAHEKIATNSEFITSDHLLLAILNEEPKTSSFKAISKILEDESLSYEIVREQSEKIHKATTNIINLDNGLQVIGTDLDEGDDATVSVIGTFSEGDSPEKVIEQIQKAFAIATGSQPIIATKKEAAPKKQKSGYPFCTNLNEKAEKGVIDDLVGREREINYIVKVLNRRRCNNAILVGESGVGKTAIVEGLAKKIVDGTAPLSLSNCKIYRLNFSELMSGSQFRGVLEDRVSSLLKEMGNNPNAILFIDNIHSLCGERQKNEFDFSGLFSQAFSDGNMKIIATTTTKGFHNTIEMDPEMKRKFQKINIERPSIEECNKILANNKKIYEDYHHVKFEDEAVNACVVLANRYITDRNLPSSALDILDEAGAEKKNEMLEPEEIKVRREAIAEYKKEKDTLIKEDKIDEAKDVDYKINGLKVEISNLRDALNDARKEMDVLVTADDIYKAIAEHTNIPVQKINVSERKSLAKIDEVLKKDIVGQDDAINVVTRAIKRNKVGLSPSNRPILSCICIGSTGTGKTLLAKKLAKEIFGDEKYLVRFDMSEYADKTAVNKLIGASAGYVGYSEGGLLTEAIKNKKHVVLLIDEIEKATEEIFNLFLQVLDEGTLTDNTGQKVDFKNVILIMTSNVGAKKAATEKGIGFVVNENMNKKDIIEKELKKKFPPEFINRLDEVVYFNNLTDDNLRNIIKLELKKLGDKIDTIGNKFTYDESVVDYIFSIIVKEKEYGARPILRAIQNEVENKITDLLIEQEYSNHEFHATCNEGQINIQ